jgi:hypothetical protein
LLLLDFLFAVGGDVESGPSETGSTYATGKTSSAVGGGSIDTGGVSDGVGVAGLFKFNLVFL